MWKYNNKTAIQLQGTGDWLVADYAISARQKISNDIYTSDGV